MIITPKRMRQSEIIMLVAFHNIRILKPTILVQTLMLAPTAVVHNAFLQYSGASAATHGAC